MRRGIGYNICIEHNPSRKKKTEYANETEYAKETELKGGILREMERWVLVRFRQSVELCGCHVGFTAKDGIFVCSMIRTKQRKIETFFSGLFEFFFVFDSSFV